ncbi:three-helix bundle dimerization domain-containing protein [Pseudonocardia lacus]|uniref:three-helix bundle dimerization domain-containing protein n=1 Tax=Pseudonocardia lacus TaxID=2835865 RepID=UPI001BDD22E9|nr:hypothetical protein [Pseudonocardia lacus]
MARSETVTGPRAAGSADAVETADEPSRRLLAELVRDFPGVDATVLAATARAALAEFADARIHLYVHVLSLRIARDLVQTGTGTRPLPRA